jgi:hypothetical protein
LLQTIHANFGGTSRTGRHETVPDGIEAREKKAAAIRDLKPSKAAGVKGGAGKIVFGAGAAPFLKQEEEKKPKKK